LIFFCHIRRCYLACSSNQTKSFTFRWRHVPVYVFPRAWLSTHFGIEAAFLTLVQDVASPNDHIPEQLTQVKIKAYWFFICKYIGHRQNINMCVCVYYLAILYWLFKSFVASLARYIYKFLFYSIYYFLNYIFRCSLIFFKYCSSFIFIFAVLVSRILFFYYLNNARRCTKNLYNTSFI
jgi:hypothetical protein